MIGKRLTWGLNIVGGSSGFNRILGWGNFMDSQDATQCEHCSKRTRQLPKVGSKKFQAGTSKTSLMLRGRLSDE